jgi:hypothetical protein
MVHRAMLMYSWECVISQSTGTAGRDGRQDWWPPDPRVMSSLEHMCAIEYTSATRRRISFKRETCEVRNWSNQNMPKFATGVTSVLARDLGKIPRCWQINVRDTWFCFTCGNIAFLRKKLNLKKSDAIHVKGRGLSISCNQHPKFGVWD